eukprot:TRINITY_DN20808_c0_g1_i1.p1 TRINITY_DN20808_c0_g1~~TRINITY_DN20808_c0_g1_i1.p1  ORF type:complete len:148 (-),score=20.45 TRINITY_DN20808_c0_g1_i1:232-675(-)
MAYPVARSSHALPTQLSPDAVGEVKNDVAMSGKVWSRHFRPSRCFMKLQITFDRPIAEPPSEEGFRATIAEAMQDAFGTCGSALCSWSLLSFEKTSGIGILRVNPQELSKVRFAVTLINRCIGCSGRRCRVDVTAAVPSLAALACDR